MSEFTKKLGSRKNMGLFVEMLIKSIKGDCSINYELSALDGFVIGLIYCNSGLLREIYSGGGVQVTDCTMQILEKCVGYISDNEPNLQKAFNEYLNY